MKPPPNPDRTTTFDVRAQPRLTRRRKGATAFVQVPALLTSLPPVKSELSFTLHRSCRFRPILSNLRPPPVNPEAQFHPYLPPIRAIRVIRGLAIRNPSKRFLKDSKGFENFLALFCDTPNP